MQLKIHCGLIEYTKIVMGTSWVPIPMLISTRHINMYTVMYNICNPDYKDSMTCKKFRVYIAIHSIWTHKYQS